MSLSLSSPLVVIPSGAARDNETVAAEDRFSVPEHLELDMSPVEDYLRLMRWIRDWQWSQQFAPPMPLCVVTGI
jgi:hypothetical protein